IIFQKKSISKEESFAKSLKNDFAKKILGKSINNLNDFVKEYVEVRIRNKFKRHKNSLALKFDGRSLSILLNDKIAHSFQAVSGRAQKIDDKHYFTYEKERQALKNEGPIPEGEYYITPLSENVNDGVQYWDKAGIWQKLFAWLSFVDIKMGSWAKATPAWGKIRIPIQPKTKLVINSKGEEVLRSNFFIHGGIQAGSAGCIDLWKNNDEFFKVFLEYVEKYKDEILQNQG
ncbi:tlde1 domain-containing protein, partial [Campylobacter troglodytis]|uniref:tlde1 domain-containing protein n=1 Tax=Campylobacter troglodytis TaxID=654363 RepID=UPI00163C6BB5